MLVFLCFSPMHYLLLLIFVDLVEDGTTAAAVLDNNNSVYKTPFLMFVLPKNTRSLHGFKTAVKPYRLNPVIFQKSVTVHH